MRLQGRLNWLDVNEVKPENHSFVLVGRSYGTECSMEAYYMDGYFYVQRYGTRMEFKHPTHWALLPTPEDIAHFINTY